MEQFFDAFKEFGKVTSAAIKDVVHKDDKFPNDTNCGFICYEKEDEAKKALAFGSRDPKVLKLYKNNDIYLTYHYRKEQYLAYKQVKQRTMAKYFARQFMSPMFFPYPMPPPMFGGNHFMGGPPPNMVAPHSHGPYPHPPHSHAPPSGNNNNEQYHRGVNNSFVL